MAGGTCVGTMAYAHKHVFSPSAGISPGPVHRFSCVSLWNFQEHGDLVSWITEEGKALSCHKEGYMITGRAEERTKKRKGIASSTDQKNRHEELTRAENYAC